ncbi:MAG: hypothetical protein M3Y41_18980, partial [Pseudomonadota bacterium]|nr:hypothetical protein [Pseudomonadota bacterium]
YDPAPAPLPDGAPLRETLRPLARANPAARGLRILEALALGTEDHFTLALLDASLRVEVRPCLTASASLR